MQRGAAGAPFPHRHLLGIEGLSPDDINYVLDLADGYVELNRQAEKKRSLLRGRTIINCFFENSTRAFMGSTRVGASRSAASGAEEPGSVVANPRIFGCITCARNFQISAYILTIT